MSILCPRKSRLDTRLDTRPRMMVWLTGTFSLFLGTVAFGQDILVFTDRGHPVQSPQGIVIVMLDEPARINAELSAHLPADPGQAATLVRQRLAGAGAAWQRQLGQAYQGVTQAWGLGVAKLPAVVVEQRYVIYGEPDVARTLEHIAAYRAAMR